MPAQLKRPGQWVACGRWLLAIIGIMSSLIVPVPVAAQRGMNLIVRVWTVEDIPVSQVLIEILDAQTRKALWTGTTDGDGQVRFEHLLPTPVRVTVRGVRPDGTPLRQVGQDQEGLWVQLPSSDWVMELRVDEDGTVFPDLDATGAGAVDGLDATAIAHGTYALTLPTAPGATSSSIAATRPTLTTTDAALAVHPTTPDGAGFGDARSASTLPAVALLVLLVTLTVIVATIAWRGKL
jgi:hypothetical protein